MSEITNYVLIPNYYNSFKCIADKCEDTCCAGWSITIDKKTLEKYKKVKDELMQRRLKKELVIRKNSNDPENQAKIKLKNGRCAFLTDKGWCDIYTHLGASYLSHTCTLYPRTMNKVGNQMECTMTPSCIEAARHMLLLEEGILFERKPYEGEKLTISATIKINQESPKTWRDYFFDLREMTMTLLKDRQYTIEQRINHITYSYEQIEEKIKGNTLEGLEEVIIKLTKQISEGKEVKPKKQSMKASREMIELAMRVGGIFKEEKVKFKAYQYYLDNLRNGLYLNGSIQFKESKDAYEKRLIQYKQQVEAKYSYVLENYLVNYMMERCMPLDGSTPLASLETFILYYDLIKLHLVVSMEEEKELKVENIVDFIHLFTKIYDHGENYIAAIKELTY